MMGIKGIENLIKMLSLVSILAVSSFAFALDEEASEVQLDPLVFNQVLFEKFTVPVEARKAPAPNFKTLPKARYFRDRIKSSFSESNFAGHYSLAPWGCGTSCVGMAISDTQTGKILFYQPQLTFGALEPKAKDAEDIVPLGIAFKENSKLLILNPLYGAPDEINLNKNTAFGNSALPRYFIWENKQFKSVSLEHPPLPLATPEESPEAD